MYVTRIIPHVEYRHPSGRRASVYGSAPLGDGWEQHREGFALVFVDHNGVETIARDGKTHATHDDAAHAANEINARRIVDYKAHAELYPHTKARCLAAIERIPSFATADAGRSRDLESAVAEFVALYAQDVREEPGTYKASVRADPYTAARSVIAGLDAGEVRKMIASLRAERRAVQKHGG